jgi:hypothetical protein
VPALGHHARQGLSRPAQLGVDAAGWAIGGALAAVAAARGGKAVHPDGVAYRGRLVVEGAADAPPASTLLSTPREWPAFVRVSRSLGLPRPLPDLLGISIRIPDAYGRGRHQDFLLVTSVDLPVLHHVFVPARDSQQRPYSSSLPYRAGDRLFIVGAVPHPGSPRPHGRDEFDRLARAAATRELRFDLAVASINGRFRRVGVLHVDARVSPTLDALRFNPFNCGGGLEPAGVLNRLRDYAYPLSQRAWGRSEGKRAAQERAELELRELFTASSVRAPRTPAKSA